MGTKVDIILEDHHEYHHNHSHDHDHHHHTHDRNLFIIEN